MRCVNCGTLNSAQSKFCRDCGASFFSTPSANGSAPTQSAPLTFEQKVEQVQNLLSSLDCGRCGFETCEKNATAIVRGESAYDSCARSTPETYQQIRRIVGAPERLSVAQRLWKILTSINVAIGLIAVLILLSIGGSLIPQGQPDLSYYNRYGATGYKLVKFFMLDQLYHSWYFLGLLAALGASTLACLSKRFSATLRLLSQPRTLSPSNLLRLENSIEIPVSGSPLRAVAQIEQVLQRRGYSTTWEHGRLSAQRHLIGRLGVDLFHFSLVLLLIGGIIGGLTGYEAFQMAHRGETFTAPGADFQVRVEDLWTESYDSSLQIKDWYTRLVVVKEGRDQLTQTIEVNHPLSYQGINFYQASYGTDWLRDAKIMLAITRLADGIKLAETELGVSATTVLDPDNNFNLKFVAFYPDFVMTDQGPVDRSMRLDNPAAFLEIYQGEALAYRGWIFAHFPDLQIWSATQSEATPIEPSSDTESHSTSNAMPYEISIAGMHAPEFTGLRITYDPGLWVIYASLALMALGMVLNFYLPPRWIWAQAQRGSLSLGGIGRDDREFMSEFEAIAELSLAAIAAEGPTSPSNLQPGAIRPNLRADAEPPVKEADRRHG